MTKTLHYPHSFGGNFLHFQIIGKHCDFFYRDQYNEDLNVLTCLFKQEIVEADSDKVITGYVSVKH